jgi:acetyl esterase
MVQRVLDKINEAFSSLNDSISERTIVMARQAMTSSKQKMEKPAPQMAHVRDLAIPGPKSTLPARLYTPMAAGHSPGPGLVFFHGGGFLVGDLAGYDNAVRRLAASARIRVLSVEYRLAPEHPFPAAHDDAKAALLWAIENAQELGMDQNQISVGGDSAGGTLSAWLAQWASQNHIELQSQLLLFPLLQLVETNSRQRKSPEAHILGRPALMAIRKHFAGNADLHDPRLSPLYGEKTSLIAPALIVTCGLDPLHSEGKAYADMLVGHGVRVRSLHFNLMPHGYLNLTALVPGAEAASLDAFEAYGRFVGTLAD